MAFSPEDTVVGPSVPAWRERALERSLADSRARSVERLGSFVAAARDLAAETGTSAFTVQQVVERSGQSLKSFYRHFEGKDDLLLALLEEDCAMGAALLTQMIDRHRSPRLRIRTWVTGLFQLMSVGDSGYVGVLTREHRRLAEVRPEPTDRALAPFIDCLAAELDAAMRAGVVRAGDPHRDAVTVFDLVLLKIHDLVLGRGNLTPAEMAEYVWSFCWNALASAEHTVHAQPSPPPTTKAGR